MDTMWDYEWFGLRIRVLSLFDVFSSWDAVCHSEIAQLQGPVKQSTTTASAKDSAEGILEEASLQRCDLLGQRWCKFSLFVPSFGDWMSDPLEGSQQFSLGIGFGGAVEPESPGMNRSNTTVSFASFKRRRRSSIHFTWLWNWGIMRCLDARYVCWHPLFSHKLHLKTNPSAKVVELIHTRRAFISHKGAEISLSLYIYNYIQ